MGSNFLVSSFQMSMFRASSKLSIPIPSEKFLRKQKSQNWQVADLGPYQHIPVIENPDIQCGEGCKRPVFTPSTSGLLALPVKRPGPHSQSMHHELEWGPCCQRPALFNQTVVTHPCLVKVCSTGLPSWCFLDQTPCLRGQTAK